MSKQDEHDASGMTREDASRAYTELDQVADALSDIRNLADAIMMLGPDAEARISSTIAGQIEFLAKRAELYRSTAAQILHGVPRSSKAVFEAASGPPAGRA